MKGTWITHYSRDTKLAKIVLSLDWHAYEGSPADPLIEWTIDTPTSEYHPGVHRGLIYINQMVQGLYRCRVRVDWKSPIYSPFVRYQGKRKGNLMSKALWGDGLVNFTDLLQSIAHVLEFGPFSPDTETASPSFTFDPHETHIWTHCKKQDATAKQAFKQAASFSPVPTTKTCPQNPSPQTRRTSNRHVTRRSSPSPGSSTCTGPNSSAKSMPRNGTWAKPWPSPRRGEP
jgi:hypothetical protein